MGMNEETMFEVTSCELTHVLFQRNSKSNDYKKLVTKENVRRRDKNFNQKNR